MKEVFVRSKKVEDNLLGDLRSIRKHLMKCRSPWPWTRTKHLGTSWVYLPPFPGSWKTNRQLPRKDGAPWHRDGKRLFCPRVPEDHSALPAHVIENAPEDLVPRSSW